MLELAEQVDPFILLGAGGLVLAVLLFVFLKSELGALRKQNQHLRSQLREQGRNIAAMGVSLEELTGMARGMRNPIDRPLLMNGFSVEEVELLKRFLGGAPRGRNAVPNYSKLEKAHPLLLAKYLAYLQGGGDSLEYLWQKHSSRKAS